MSNYIGEYKIGGELQFAQRRTHWMTSNLKSEVDLKIRNDLGSMKKTKQKKNHKPKGYASHPECLQTTTWSFIIFEH